MTYDSRGFPIDHPEPTGRAMLTEGHAELYRVLLETSEEAPLPVLANCIEVMATVLNRRLHDEMGEIFV
jgi:hypothetical protein